MKIEKLSNDFTPRDKGLLFAIDTESDDPLTLEVEVVDKTTNEVVATQLLREITSAKVNIAPYVKPFTEYKPSLSAQTTIKELPTASYAIRVDGTESEPLRISVNNCPVESPALISSMPHGRYISYGESDELLLIVEPYDLVTATITTNEGETLEVESTITSGTATLIISTEDFGADTRSIDVELKCDGALLEKLHYTIRPSHRKGVRLAWLSERGSIEHYTFPIMVKNERKSFKESIVTEQERRVIKASTEYLMSLSSRYEPRSTIEALAEIISSPKVWLEGKTGWREVEVKSSSIESDIFGSPDKVALTISKWRREEVVL